MGFEDISGTRTFWSNYVGLAPAAASGTILPTLRGYVMQKPFTIIGAAIGAGTTPPAGTSMSLKFWVNGVRKGIGSITLTSGGGARVSSGSGYVFTGPANSLLDVSVNTVGNTAGVGARYAIYYHHGMR
jgi:hypothetical protein